MKTSCISMTVSAQHLLCCRRTVWLAGGLLLTAGWLDGCSADSHRDDTGAATLSLVSVPEDVSCVHIVANGNRPVEQFFDVAPGAAADLLMAGLPIGMVRFSGEAFAGTCDKVAGSSPTWIAAPASAVLAPNQVARVELTMQRPQSRALVSVDFVDDAGSVPDGEPSDAPLCTWYRDADGDGFGDPAQATTGPCTGLLGFVANQDDCCDASADTFPGQTTSFITANACGNFDYNCDGLEVKKPRKPSNCGTAVCGMVGDVCKQVGGCEACGGNCTSFSQVPCGAQASVFPQPCVLINGTCTRLAISSLDGPQGCY